MENCRIVNGTIPIYHRMHERTSSRVYILFILKFYPARIFQQHAYFVIRFNFHHSEHFPASSLLIYRINSSVARMKFFTTAFPTLATSEKSKLLHGIGVSLRDSSTPDSFDFLESLDDG